MLDVAMSRCRESRWSFDCSSFPSSKSPQWAENPPCPCSCSPRLRLRAASARYVLNPTRTEGILHCHYLIMITLIRLSKSVLAFSFTVVRGPHTS